MDVENTDKALIAYEKWIVDHFPDKSVDFVDSPTFADFDFYVYINDHLSHYIEVKKRNNKRAEYETTKVPLRKHATAEHFFKAKNIRTYYVCEFTDCVAYLKLWEEPDSVETMVARHDRGDDEDIYALFNISKFIKIT